MIRRLRRNFAFFLLSGLLVTVVIFFNISSLDAQQLNTKSVEQRELSQLRSEFGEGIAIKTGRSTGKVNFIRLNPEVSGGLTSRAKNTELHAAAMNFLRAKGHVFGLSEPETELTGGVVTTGGIGDSHLSYLQTYRGMPVFGGTLKLHFNSSGELRAVNGNIVPYLNIDTTPVVSSDTAANKAVAQVSQKTNNLGLRSLSARLLIYRTGMAQGVPGENHLAWQIEVASGINIREFVFVDAQNGEVVDQISGKYDAKDRRLYDSGGISEIPPSYPLIPFWREGFLFPTGNSLADPIILGSGETYDFYKKSFGRDSYDGNGGPMVSFFNFGFAENAFQDFFGNQAVTVYGDGFTSDDVVAHEWTHAYTAFTHGLIYAWQPGALNEAYSDIFGEVIDLTNGRGLDLPGGGRDIAENACSIFSTPLPVVRINTPMAIAGEYEAAYNVFGSGAPDLSTAGLRADIVRVDDGVGDPADGCSTPFANATDVNGKIAFIDVSFDCFAVTKVKNAQLNGAVAVVLANEVYFGDAEVPFGGDGTVTSIPAVNVGKSTGDLIRNQLTNGVNATLFNTSARNSDNTYRWLLGEEDVAYGKIEAFRDMWNPNCYFNPTRGRDSQYQCADYDNGGVHSNSSIPNHTFALLADGGNFNGQTIRGIGLTKAAHIYFRAMTVYQVPFTDFADHAEALETSAHDLLGRDLPDVRTGLPSGERIGPSDLRQLHSATLATELRDPPTQCDFRPILGKNPPSNSCSLSGRQGTIFSDSFEGNPFVRWTTRREVASESTFRGGNWSWVRDLPDGRRGSGFFAYDFEGGCSLPYPSQNGVLELVGPVITIPGGLAAGPHLSFDHWVELEDGYDGAQLMISVNGGPFGLVDPSAFIYNSYNRNLLNSPFSTNVRMGQPAFSGTDAGSLTGSWGTSIVDLSLYANGGDTIRLRFDMSTDYCFGTGSGWYLDNVRVYSCDSTVQN
jgi:Zn-dependent metalloprotease